ncbi:MAG: polysaccharide biosynthesis tyrosine autokinase [Nitrospirae bacterium]|nr:polysaccharide biosynthesis tyrosine autokinase [Nitrospirota bacterium]
MELRRYWEILLRWKWIFLAIVVSVMVLSFIPALILNPVYESTSKVMINLKDISPEFVKGLPTSLGKFEVADVRNVVGTFQAMIENSQSINNVVRELEIKDSDGIYIPVDNFLNPNIITLIIKGTGVEVEQISDAETFEITGYDRDLNKAAKIANATANALLKLYNQLNREIASANRVIILKRIDELLKTTTEIEKKKATFQKKEMVINIEQQTSALLKNYNTYITQQMNTAINITEMGIRLQETAKKIESTEEFKLSSVNLEQNPLITDYKKELLALELSLAQDKIEKTPEHPDVKATIEKILVARDTLKREIDKTLSAEVKSRNSYFDTLVESLGNTEINLITAKASLDAVELQVKKIERQLNQLPEQQIKIDSIDRELEAYKEVHVNLLNNLESIKSAEALDVSNALITEPAVLLSDDPDDYLYFPKVLLIGVLSLLIGTFFGVAAVFFLEYIDESVVLPHDVKSILKVNSLGCIPRLHRRGIRNGLQIKSRDFNMSMVRAAYNVKSLLLEKSLPKMLAVVSAEKGAGKSTMCVYLGKILADSGLRTLIIDLNLTSVTISKLLEINASVGLNDLFESQDISGLIQRSGINGLDIIRTSGDSFQLNELLQMNKFCQNLENLSSLYDIVFIDMPAITDSSEAFPLDKAIPGAIFVVSSGNTSRSDLMVASEIINSTGIKTAGFILNKFRTLGLLKL